METLKEDESAERRRPGLPRRITFYVLVSLFAFLIAYTWLPLLVFGFLEEAATHRVHETSFGMIFTLSLAGLLAQLRRPDRKIAQMWQVPIPIWLVILAILFIGDPLSPDVLLYLLLPAILFALHPGRSLLLRPPINPSRRLGALTVVVAVPLVVFAVGQFREGQEASEVAGGVVERVLDSAPDDATDEQIENRIERAVKRAGDTPEEDEAALHFGHWSAMAAFAIAIICLAALASLRVPGWRLPAWGAGIAAAFYGAASLYAPNDASAANTTWAVLAIAWGLGFVVAAEWVARQPQAAPAAAAG